MNGAALLLIAGTWFAQLPYSNPELGFAMSLPDGFLGEYPDPLAPQSIACFVAPSVRGLRGWVRVCVERQGGSLPRSAGRLTFAWKGSDLPGARFESERVGEPVVVFATLVPLRTEPVWLVAMAPRADAGHAQSALVSTLASLQGESGELSRTERAERAGEKFGWIASILFALGVGMWIGRRRQRQRELAQRL